jgi:hypothetical protein
MDKLSVVRKLPRGFVNIILLGFFLVLQTTTGCEAASEHVKLTELRRIVSERDIDNVYDYLEDLSLESRIEIARFAVADSDNYIKLIGIKVLVESGLPDEAVPALSNRVLEGDDLTAFGYAWTHSDDPQLAVRMYLKISRYLLVRYEDFDAGQKEKTERFIVSNLGRSNRLEKFSIEAAEQRLSQVETELIQSE